MRTLVTGGARFIGPNLVDALLARGDQVAVIDDLCSGLTRNLQPALDAAAAPGEGPLNPHFAAPRDGELTLNALR